MLANHRQLVDRLARGGLDSPIFKLSDVRCMIALNHRDKNSQQALDYWTLALPNDTTAEQWGGIVARRQAAMLLEGFGPGDDALVTHALLDVLEDSGRTLATINVLDALERVLQEAPMPALAGITARAPLVAEQALATLKREQADARKGDPSQVLGRLSALCGLRRRGRHPWPVGERPFPSALAFAALRSGLLATLLSLLHHKDAEGRDVGAAALFLLRALPLHALTLELRQRDDPDERAEIMVGVSLPLLLRLTDAVMLRHRGGDMRRLWNLGVLSVVLGLAEPEDVRRVWAARKRALAFTMLASLSVGYHEQWVRID
jgi:hypothetical protein